MSQKNVPGRVATSCLTCRRGHRKCDMRQPICMRCEKAGLECLGYGHNQRGVARSALPKVLKPRPILPKGQEIYSTPLVESTNISARWKSSTEENNFESTLLEMQLYLGDMSNLDLTPIESSQLPTLCYSDSRTESQQWDCSAKPRETHDYPQLFSLNPYQRAANEPPPSLHQFFLALPSSPSDPIIAYLSSPQFEDYASSLLDRTMAHAYFKPMKDYSAQLRGAMISRIRNSPSSRWVIFISMKICEDIVDGDTLQTDVHNRWIEDIAAAISRRLTQNLTPQEAEYLRGDWLEISIISSVFGRGPNPYVALRNATPTFLQNAYSLPDLWSSGSDPTLIPLLSVIGSGDHALSCYTLIDCMCAMSFGLPQQVEYDTTVGTLPKNFLPHEWATGTPTEFHILLADINTSRDKSPRARDWREIEYTLAHWESRAVPNDEYWESWMAVAWLAVQESWRLALLAYLYLVRL
ncbi:unnamed protein product [Rhizoctonia solani]|uniref:Zn(2)-C6 fungal-type domain-containing protein n=1 Tax=Rhizoctonia solani TaxID=456999 RepID=A0A8H3H0E0_9AGAM|nr:unnamed protein product [Rhizoctonia solani]